MNRRPVASTVKALSHFLKGRTSLRGPVFGDGLRYLRGEIALRFPCLLMRVIDNPSLVRKILADSPWERQGLIAGLDQKMGFFIGLKPEGKELRFPGKREVLIVINYLKRALHQEWGRAEVKDKLRVVQVLLFP